MIDKNDIENFVRQVYSSGITTYDRGDHVCVTNGSAAMHADISIRDDSLHVTGERYRRTFDEQYDRTYDGLKRALVHIGL
jgi:hypothetical protein